MNIIHQIWDKEKVPPEVTEWINSWKKNHPDWTHILWTAEKLRTFIIHHYPNFISIYDNYSQDIMRYDAVRYFLLHYYGGIYADVDTLCLKNMEHLLIMNFVNLSIEPAINDTHLANTFMYAPKQARFIQYLINLLHEEKGDSVLNTAGPEFLEKAYKEYSGQDVTIMDNVRIIQWCSEHKGIEEGDPIKYINFRGDMINDYIYAETHVLHFNKSYWS